jgi:mannan endo-1,4-beta-mannosidase
MSPRWPSILPSAAAAGALAALSVPAVHTLRDDAAIPPPPAAVAGPRAFGIYVDPWHLDDWTRAVGGARPRMLATFEAFSKRRTLDAFLGESARRGVPEVMVSWEPWRPVPTALGTTAQQTPQPGYRNREIADGVQDAYIVRFAQSLARYPGLVWLRYAHEMNGWWYPWSHDAYNYRRAWRHVVGLFRAAGAQNVKFVWSVNPSLYEPAGEWYAKVGKYWPGADYVDAVGSTMISFGGSKRYPVARFAPRLAALRGRFGRPVLLTEVNTERRGRVRWLHDLDAMVNGMPWIRAIAWSQLPSRGTAHMRRAGDLTWDVQRDGPGAAALAPLTRPR